MKHIGIDRRRLDVAMPQQLLDGSNVRAAFEQVRGKRISKCVAGGPLGEPGLCHGISDGFLYQGFVKMMATLFFVLRDPPVFLGKIHGQRPDLCTCAEKY